MATSQHTRHKLAATGRQPIFLGCSAPTQAGMRPDIQTLRTVAVGIVVLYHLWPLQFPGGFVGVDVFFVISGFLITSHLLKDAGRPGGIRPLTFWTSRIRRLIPLAVVVLLATVAGILAFMPRSVWSQALTNTVWSALYVENWALADASINYLGGDTQALPTQHFWSLSAEEQFYFVWPLLFIAAIWVATRGANRASSHGSSGARAHHDEMRAGRYAMLARRGVFAVTATIIVVSLAWSIYYTATSPERAYFVTTTRAWEFAAGGLLAFVPVGFTFIKVERTRQFVRVVASWGGMLVLVATTLVLTTAIPFPSATALIPVAATMALLVAGDVRGITPNLLSRLRPVTWIGDISYGIYLWHWPLVILVPIALGAPLTIFQKVAVALGAVVLAAVSKKVIEDPFRFGSFFSKSRIRSFSVAVVGATTVAASVVFPLQLLERDAQQSRELASSLEPFDTENVDGLLNAESRRITDSDAEDAFDRLTYTDPELPLVPLASTRGQDNADMYTCFDLTRDEGMSCSYGNATSDVRIAITGDSHAAQYIPAFKAIVEENGWTLDTYVGINCDATLAPACADGLQQFESLRLGDYDLIVYSVFRGSASPIDQVTDYWNALVALDVPILPIIDQPFNSQRAFDCIDAAGAAAAETCRIDRRRSDSDWPERVGPLAAASNIEAVDSTALQCFVSDCLTVTRNVVVYQDTPGSHYTRSYVMLLQPTLERYLRQRLDAP